MKLSALLTITADARWSDTKDREKSIRNAREVVALLGADKDVRRLEPKDFRALAKTLEARGQSGATVNRKLAALSSMLSVAREENVVAMTPPVPRRREGEHRTRTLDEAELVRLWAALEERAPASRLFFEFLSLTGLRVGEALSLKWAHVEGTWLRIWESKGGKARSVPILPRVAEILQARRSEPAPWQGFTPRRVQHAWDKAKALMGLASDAEFVPHCLRHTFASALLRKTGNLVLVQRALGHASIKTTTRYAHMSDKDLEEAMLS